MSAGASHSHISHQQQQRHRSLRSSRRESPVFERVSSMKHSSSSASPPTNRSPTVTFSNLRRYGCSNSASVSVSGSLGASGSGYSRSSADYRHRRVSADSTPILYRSPILASQSSSVTRRSYSVNNNNRNRNFYSSIGGGDRNRIHSGGTSSSVIPNDVPPLEGRRRTRPRPLNMINRSSYTSESTDCSVASSTSPPRSTTSSTSSAGSPPPPIRYSPSANSSTSPVHIRSPRSPRSPKYPSSLSNGLYPMTFMSSSAQPSLSPIPPSPQPSTTPTNPLPSAPAPSSPKSQKSPSPARSPRYSPSPHSPYHSPFHSPFHSPLHSPRPNSPHSPFRPPSPSGNFAILASRRKSCATTSAGRRRTSNFLELPTPDHERQQRRYCSLPERGYNPRQSGEFYRLRSFSISNKGAVIKLGDQIASRRSRSSAGSTANTSRSPSQHASPLPSRSGSREVSPRAKSPTGYGSSPRSPWSTCGSSFQDDDQETLGGGIAEENQDDGPKKFRVCMLGHSGTGKTSLVSQFLTSEYMSTYDASLDDEYGERSVCVALDGIESELFFIDHPTGEMSVENTLSTYDPDACVVVYSIVDRNSFQTAEEILGYLWRMGCNHNKSLILVANKVDLERSRIISQEEGKNLAMSLDAKFIETSAGIQHNCDELLVGTLKQIQLRQQQLEKEASKKNSSSSSPLHTLQVARDILSKVCLKASSQNSISSKSCENLHVL